MTPKEILNLAQQAVEAGDLTRAAQFYRQVLASAPKHAKALKGLRKVERLAPTNARSVDQNDVSQALSLIQSGSFKSADILLNDLIERAPTLPVLFNLRAIALSNLSNNDGALASFETAVALEPANGEYRNNLALKLKETGQTDKAVKQLQTVIRRYPNYAEAHFNLGTVYDARDDFEQAERSFQTAVRLQPNFELAWRELGKLLATHGQRARAADCLHKAIALSPDSYFAYVALVKIEKPSADSVITHKLVDFARAGILTGLDLAVVCFALGKIFEDNADYARSFAYYEQGNALQRAFGDYSIASTGAEFQSLQRIYTGGSDTAVAQNRHTVPQPIFIVGMNRSGTSLIEQMLACHSDVHGGGELETINDLAQDINAGQAMPDADAIRTFARAYLSHIGTISDRLFFTDKMPSNFKWIGLIRAAFPTAPIIYMRREARDLCFSNFKASFGVTGHMYVYDQVELAAFHNMFGDLMDHWLRVHGDTILTLDYEALIDDTEAQARRVLAFCGLDWQDEVLNFHQSARAVRTLSQDQVRAPIYRTSLGAWENYAPYLAPLLKTLDAGDAANTE